MDTLLIHAALANAIDAVQGAMTAKISLVRINKAFCLITSIHKPGQHYFPHIRVRNLFRAFLLWFLARCQRINPVYYRAASLSV